MEKLKESERVTNSLIIASVFGVVGVVIWRWEEHTGVKLGQVVGIIEGLCNTKAGVMLYTLMGTVTILLHAIFTVLIE